MGKLHDQARRRDAERRVDQNDPLTWRVDRGQYVGQTWRWLCENDPGYAVWAARQWEDLPTPLVEAVEMMVEG